MNEQNNHAALTIAQQYPPTQYNLLVPMQTVTEIADIQKPVMNSVSISTNLNDGEIYEMEKAKDEWRDSKGYVHKATPAKYALTKKGLTKLMRAAGIKILSSRPVVPSTCQKCAEVNRSIGKPIRCGGCPNKDVKHEVRISVPQLTGENVTIVAHKEIAVEDVTAGMTEKQRAEFMKFRSEMCESKALNRALRTAMDDVKMNINFTPEVWTGRQLNEKTPSSRWVGATITGSMTRRRTNNWLKTKIKEYQATGATPELVIQGIMDDANSDYYAAHGSDVVTCVGCVLTGDLPLTALDAESGSVVDDVINFNIKNII